VTHYLVISAFGDVVSRHKGRPYALRKRNELIRRCGRDYFVCPVSGTLMPGKGVV